VDERFIWYGDRTDAGRRLPPYYLVYFLLVDLLGFIDLGREEKVAWSVPVDFEGEIYSIEHRKFGVGVFVPNPKEHEERAQQIVSLIRKGVKAAEPYFEWLAERAIQTSALNVTNNSAWLYDRYAYLRDAFRSAIAEAHARKDERHTRQTSSTGTVTHVPWIGLKTQAGWLALAAIDAFFSWTEHIFIHLAILIGHATKGQQVADLVKADWKHKFKQALDVRERDLKKLFDDLVVIKGQLRNFVAHGAFGKNGEAFHFHSAAGAVPVMLTDRTDRYGYSISGELSFDDKAAILIVEKFIGVLWSGEREPARIYIQESGLPLILTMASDGTYARAMSSVEDMSEFVEALSEQFDNAANMDW
jgi:hypothetical protein